ncbi:enoyl-CoA hydratase/isomerase family protein [Endozoicomonas acroporae]|uniref:enoyl-CoA hydratase/isomerase family protein n=1 Tax=Endozoicomonas acroporae TaxID=1701104 RepID=UPI001FD288C5|nr:enoyl-CoA hydratase-related protein [Endozoicomonas acroporae]
MTVTYDLQNKIGVITINNPPVNALSQPVREGLKGTIEKAQHDDSELLIIICTGRTFIAGADISEFGKMPMEPSLPDVVNLIEASAKPVIAAIHGTALGGGFEVALACHYRIAVPSAKVGLPEVKLGLLPGAGGTQRAPRLAGVKNALDLMTSGHPMKAARAQSIELLDSLVEGNLLTGAIEFANTLLADNPEVRRVSDITIDPAQIEPGLFDAYRARLAKRARGQIAPQKIVACVEAAVNQPINKGLELERKLFVECLLSPESQGLRHLFFAERKAVKINGLPKETRAKAIQSVGIIGGGTMGGGIAMNFANAGIPVTLLEIDEQALQRGKDIIASNYGITVKKASSPGPKQKNGSG